MFGDTKQLAPVGDVALWDFDSQSRRQTVHSGLQLFNLFDKVVTLKEVIRQGDPSQQLFRDILMRIRVGEATEYDYETLKTRVNGIAKDSHEFLQSNYLHLSPTNDKCNEINEKMLHQLALNPDQRICTMYAVHTGNKIAVEKAKTFSSEDFQGLVPILQLAVGARIMVTTNLWVSKGIMNGALGTVRYFLYRNNESPPLLPRGIIVEMDANYSGPSIDGYSRHIIFNPISNSIGSDETRVERTQYPLKLAFSVTIHKCQGH